MYGRVGKYAVNVPNFEALALPAMQIGAVAVSSGAVAAVSSGAVSSGAVAAVSSGAVSSGAVAAVSSGAVSSGAVAAVSSGAVAAVSSGAVAAVSSGAVAAVSSGAVAAVSSGQLRCRAALVVLYSGDVGVFSGDPLHSAVLACCSCSMLLVHCILLPLP